MNQFDIVVLIIFGGSALAGLFRGAARETVTVAAFLMASAAAMFGLRYAGPMGRAIIDPDWAGNVAAVIAVFLVVYILLRLIGAALARRIRDDEVMGPLDRIVGLGFGMVRGFVFLGALNLFFNAATPPEHAPTWITQARTYPITAAAGRILVAFAPKGLDFAGRLKPSLEKAVRDGAGDSGAVGAYDAPDRDAAAGQVESAR